MELVFQSNLPPKAGPEPSATVNIPSIHSVALQHTSTLLQALAQMLRRQNERVLDLGEVIWEEETDLNRNTTVRYEGRVLNPQRNA